MRKNRRANQTVEGYLRRPYSRILIPQEDGRYATEILEFPGCFSEGDTPEIAYRNLEDAAAAWVAACIAGGMSVPEPLTNYDVSGKFALRLPKSLYLRASKAASRDGVSLNQYMMNAVAEKLGASAAKDGLSAVLAELKQFGQRILESQFQVADNSPTNSPLGVDPGRVTMKAETGSKVLPN